MEKNYIKDITIQDFRGINYLELNDLSDVNLFLGTNNGGKTSVLEAIATLRSDCAYNLLSICLERTQKHVSLQDLSFLFSFNRKKFVVDANMIDGSRNTLACTYRTEITTFDPTIFRSSLDSQTTSAMLSLYAERNHLAGKQMPIMDLTLDYNGKKTKESFLDLDLAFGRIRKLKQNEMNIVYVNPADHYHIEPMMLNPILKDPSLSALLSKIMKLFDPEIDRFEILLDDTFANKEIYVVKTDGTKVPISIYGDGSKKALILAIAVAQAKNGLLLIDEVETSVHHSLLEDICYFLVKAAKKFQVQLYITTHSEETINCFYDVMEGQEEQLRLYTIRKDKSRNLVRKLNGAEAMHYTSVGAEVRD